MESADTPNLVMAFDAFVTQDGQVYTDKYLFLPPGACAVARLPLPPISLQKAAANIFPVMFVIDSVYWGPFHSLIDSISRMMPFAQLLARAPHVAIHASENSTYVRESLAFFGVDPARLVTGDAGARVVLVPERVCTDSRTGNAARYLRMMRRTIARRLAREDAHVRQLCARKKTTWKLPSSSFVIDCRHHPHGPVRWWSRPAPPMDASRLSAAQMQAEEDRILLGMPPDTAIRLPETSTLSSEANHATAKPRVVPVVPAVTPMHLCPYAPLEQFNQRMVAAAAERASGQGPWPKWSGRGTLLVFHRTHVRGVANHGELMSALASCFPSFELVELADDGPMHVADIFRRVHDAAVIVAPHGAGLSNVVAARRGALVLEFLKPWLPGIEDVSAMNMVYREISMAMGIKHYTMVPHYQAPGEEGEPAGSNVAVTAARETRYSRLGQFHLDVAQIVRYLASMLYEEMR
eukprot:jgi/Mesvir1/23659/Mv18321-RA.1